MNFCTFMYIICYINGIGQLNSCVICLVVGLFFLFCFVNFLIKFKYTLKLNNIYYGSENDENVVFI